MSTIRFASEQEDNKLSLILHNAFLPLWNHNWFHNISSPIPPIEFGDTMYTPTHPLSVRQSERAQFYLSLVKLTRLLGGSIIVSTVDFSLESYDEDDKDIGAILLWLPPNKRFNLLRNFMLLYRSGFLGLIPRYGLKGFYRINFIYEGNVESMFSNSVDKPSECGFVQMLAINPKHAGKGYASALLAHQISEHFKAFPSNPVILDTSTEQGVRVYERLGFTLLEERQVDIGTDSRGIRPSKDKALAVREAKAVCVQRVMIKKPEN